MSFLKDMIVKKVGEKAEDCVRDILGIGSEDDDKDDKAGGIFDIFGGGDDKKEKEKGDGGLFSFGSDKKKDKDNGGIFSNIFGKDDDVQEKSGFHGLFSEKEAVGDARGNEGETEGGSEDGKGHSVEVNDGDLFQDLMDVADETSRKE